MNDTKDNCIAPGERRHSRTFRTMIGLLVLLVAGTTATVAFSMGHHGGYGPLARMADRLDLTATQQESIESILQASREEAEPLRAELQGMRKDLRPLMQTDEFYEDQVRAKVGAHSDTMIELAVLGARTMHAVRAELTPEQQAQAEAMFDRMAAAGPGRRGWGGRGRGWSSGE